jgi:hypothetical protein
VSATPQTRLTRCWRRPLWPALTLGIFGAVGIGVCVLLVALARPPLSALERNLVGRWFTTHGNVATVLELCGDRSVTVSQTICVALSPESMRVFGPTVTTGRWRAEGGHLHLETAARHFRATPWKKLGVFVRSQRWPAEGELHRDWRIEILTDDRLGFTDAGTGLRGRAVKAPSMLTQTATGLVVAVGSRAARAP